MISHLFGNVAHLGDNFVVLDVHGVGYRVHMTVPDLVEVRATEATVKVYTHMSVREDGMFLYGFLSPDALEMFLMLTSVTRVGPALAQGILSQISIPDFAAAIIGEDEKILTGISGIGTKSARRLIVELKDTMQKKADLYGKDVKGPDPVRNDAIRALLSLGFSPKESRDAVESAIATMKSPGLQEVIKAALIKLKER
ncbi:MAG TPA: Holliday junction branch migration protein RuvA [Methanoregulaceae archaeon]|nr:Holliday junction branch migration protein RuvA [Methanoregulaceae archaeon]